MAKLLENTQKPLWAKEDLFPLAGNEGYGVYFYDRRPGEKDKMFPLENEMHLQQVIANDKDDAIALVWTPESKYCVVPEAVPALFEPLKEARTVSSFVDVKKRSETLRIVLLVGGVYLAWLYYKNSSMEFFKELFHRSNFMMLFLLALMFVVMPWYDARKKWQEVKAWTPEKMKEAADLAYFESWLQDQKVWYSKALIGLLGIVGIAQAHFTDKLWWKAALIRGDMHEKWRLLTAPMMHGGIFHFYMNATALFYLGKRMEALAGWVHVPIVFLFSAWCGGEASLRFATPGGISLGASGGIMGMLGFLLVFEMLHHKLVPRSSKRRLVAAIGGTALLGLIGYSFIDNFAHAGGLLGGMVYAALVFPKSDTVRKPKANLTDKILATLSSAIILFGAYLAITKMAS